ncbi:MAG: hypothetical protein ACLU9V_01545 [Roseburia sp.]
METDYLLVTVDEDGDSDALILRVHGSTGVRGCCIYCCRGQEQEQKAVAKYICKRHCQKMVTRTTVMNL